MSSESTILDESVRSYLRFVTLRESPILKQLRAETANLPQARMQISPEQGQFMSLLVELTGARLALEIGTFTGYSALCMAAALPPGGRLIACDIRPEWTAIARRYWRDAGVTERIDLRLGPALETLAALEREHGTEQFDLAFIDADKANYAAYYEQCLRLLRPGGVVLIDNALWSGRVADAADGDADTRAIRDLNRRIAEDPCVSAALVPIGDGLWIARKRSAAARGGPA